LNLRDDGIHTHDRLGSQFPFRIEAPSSPVPAW